ncbi:MAG: 3-methyl-2-oxobutanoate hydroxymethyltransferase [Syntrophales bacterium]|nr:3-methyl-2-oxobutanoate hydroxymethyltransferase [Syntrophales bacterium]
MKKITIPSFREKKRAGQRVTMITVYDHVFARLVEASEAEMILVGDSLGMVIQGLPLTNPVTLEEIIYHTNAVRRGAPDTLVVGDMPFMSYQVSPEAALTSAGRIVKESGADCVKLEGGVHAAPSVLKITRAGIPVIGHIGLTPQSSSALGGFKVQGKTKEEADQLIADARALDEAGVFAIVLECIPSGVAKVITESVRATTIGVGAGPWVDGHNLNAYDLLGLFGDFVPRFARRYKKMGMECTEVFNAFTQDVRSGDYPAKEETYGGGPEIDKHFPLR